MTLTILAIWAGALLIGISGAAAALSHRWVRALVFIAMAAAYSLLIMSRLRGGFAVSLYQAGDIYLWATMLGLTAMWLALAIGTSMATWKERGGSATA